MLTPEMAGEKLREMRIFTPPGVVMTIVLHLMSGGKQSELYMSSPPIASNNTILKIKKLLNAGDLDWMTDELASLNLLLDRMVEASDKDQVSAIVRHIDGWEIHKDKDGLGRFRLRIIEEAEGPLKDWVWSVSNLERLGIPTGAALQILQEFDGLLMARNSSEVMGNDYTYLIKFRGFEFYLYLHHLVHLMQKYPTAPYDYASKATAFYTRGDIESDESIQAAGEDILRYEVWDGTENEEAYYQSLKRYKRTPKRNADLRDQIDHLLKGNGDG